MVAQKAFKIAQELNLSMYDNYRNNAIIDESYHGAFSKIDSSLDLAQIIEHGDKGFYLGNEFFDKLVMSCAQDSNPLFREFFYTHYQQFLPVIGLKELNRLLKWELEKSPSNPQHMLDLIFNTHPLGLIDNQIGETAELLLNQYPHPQGAKAFMFYIQSHPETENENEDKVSISPLQKNVLKKLKTHISTNPKDFSIKDFLKLSVQAENEAMVFSLIPIEKTVVIAFSYWEIVDYMSLFDFDRIDASNWMRDIKEILEKEGTMLGVHSADIQKDEATCKMYINLVKESWFNQDNLIQSLHDVMSHIKNLGNSHYDFIKEQTNDYLKKYWFHKKLSDDVENREEESDKGMDMDYKSSSKMKI